MKVVRDNLKIARGRQKSYVDSRRRDLQYEIGDQVFFLRFHLGKENLTYEEIPVQIVDRKEQVLGSKVIPLVKVLWKKHEREAATWEPEAQMRHQYPHLFSG